MYNLGIIGGMGSLATVKFFEELLVNDEEAVNDSTYVNTIILNHATMPDRTECILNDTPQLFLEAIKKDFEILESVGVKAVAIPCNTSHYFYEYYKKYTKIHVINMIEETVKCVKNMGKNKIVVFGTKGTLESKIYDKYASKYDIDVVELYQEDKDLVMEIIYTIKSTKKIDKIKFNSILKKYVSDDVMGIVACTELSMIPLDNVYTDKTLDALVVLARESLKYKYAKDSSV